MSSPNVLEAWVVPGMPHPLLCPEKNPGYASLKKAYERAAKDLQKVEADILILYSTFWPSVIGHQIQADPHPEWNHVDEEWHELGSIPYKFKMDADFAESYNRACAARGLHSRTVSYKGFPIDTGSVVTLKLLNPNNRLPAIIISSNVYADRAETVLLGKAVQDALVAQNKKAVAISVTALSNRQFAEKINFSEDRIHSLKDQEWNMKILEFLKEGRLEDVAQLSRQIHREARVPKVTNFKSFWWLSSVMGQSNRFRGEVYDYQAVYGTGAAIIRLQPSETEAANLEFDEESLETYRGDRNVLGS